MKIKRSLIQIRLLGAILLLGLPAAVQAQTDGDYDYTDNGDGTATITGYIGSGGAVIIPNTISNLTVTSIGDGEDSVFADTEVTSVTISNSVTSIGDFAFAGSGFASVTIGNNVTSIGDYAFFYCTSLTNVTIPNSVTNLGRIAFSQCTSLINVTIGNNVTGIEDQAFDSCYSLTNVTIGNSVTSIGYYSFNYCTSLTSVTIPNSVISIAQYAFYACSSLTNVIIGSGVTDIAEGAFWNSDNLTAITVDALNSVYSSIDGVLLNKSQTTLIKYPGGKGVTYTIPNSVTSIGDEAFEFSQNLTSVSIGTNVTYIAEGAFYYCPALISVAIPNSVTSIGSEAFGGCYSLTAIAVDTNNPVYSSVDGVLFDKSQTTLIQCPGGKAGNYTISSSVVNIGDYAFYNCTSLTNVTIGNNVSNIGLQAFLYCYGLTTVTIPNSVSYIASGAFADTGLISIYFQGNPPSIGSGLLNLFDDDNYNLTAYYLPGIAGWEATYDRIPTTLWLPQMQTTDASFAVQTNQFGFNINWASGQMVVVEACTNLSNPDWQPVQTNTLTTGSSYFSDSHWTNYPSRFYRLRLP